MTAAFAPIVQSVLYNSFDKPVFDFIQGLSKRNELFVLTAFKGICGFNVFEFFKFIQNTLKFRNGKKNSKRFIVFAFYILGM